MTTSLKRPAAFSLPEQSRHRANHFWQHFLPYPWPNFTHAHFLAPVYLTRGEQPVVVFLNGHTLCANAIVDLVSQQYSNQQQRGPYHAMAKFTPAEWQSALNAGFTSAPWSKATIEQLEKIAQLNQARSDWKQTGQRSAQRQVPPVAKGLENVAIQPYFPESSHAGPQDYARMQKLLSYPAGTYPGQEQDQQMARQRLHFYRLHALTRAAQTMAQGGGTAGQEALKLPGLNAGLRSGALPLAPTLALERLFQEAGSLETLTKRAESFIEALTRPNVPASSASPFATGSQALPPTITQFTQANATQGSESGQLVERLTNAVMARMQKLTDSAIQSPDVADVRMQMQSIVGKLNYEQRAIVNSDLTKIMVLGAGGSGKTEVALARLERMVSEKGLPLQAVRFLSPTHTGLVANKERFGRDYQQFHPELNREQFEKQFSTVHAFMLSQLSKATPTGKKDERGEPETIRPIHHIVDASGKQILAPSARLIGAGSDLRQSAGSLEDMVSKAGDSEHDYLRKVLMQQGVKQKRADSLANRAMSYINTVKGNQGNQQAYQSALATGEKLYEQGDRERDESVFYMLEQALHNEKGFATMGQRQQGFLLSDIPHFYSLAGQQKLTKLKQATWMDEFQAGTKDMFRALRANSNPSIPMLFSGDPGQRIVAQGGNPVEWLQKLFPDMGTEVLSANYRLTQKGQSQVNALNYGRSGGSHLQVAVGGRVGENATYSLGSTLTGAHEAAFLDWLTLQGLSLAKVKTNMGQGLAPFTGAAYNAVEAPFIFHQHDERMEFERNLLNLLKRHMGAQLTDQFRQWYLSKDIPGTKKSTPDMLHLLMDSQSLSRGYLHPFASATRGGKWDDEGWLNLLSIDAERAMEQMHWFSTKQSFERGTYHNNAFDELPGGQQSLVSHGFGQIERLTAYMMAHVHEADMGQFHPSMQFPDVENAPNALGQQVSPEQAQYLQQFLSAMRELSEVVPPQAQQFTPTDAGSGIFQANASELLPANATQEMREGASKFIEGFASMSSSTPLGTLAFSSTQALPSMVMEHMGNLVYQGLNRPWNQEYGPLQDQTRISPSGSRIVEQAAPQTLSDLFEQAKQVIGRDLPEGFKKTPKELQGNEYDDGAPTDFLVPELDAYGNVKETQADIWNRKESIQGGWQGRNTMGGYSRGAHEDILAQHLKQSPQVLAHPSVQAALSFAANHAESLLTLTGKESGMGEQVHLSQAHLQEIARVARNLANSPEAFDAEHPEKDVQIRERFRQIAEYSNVLTSHIPEENEPVSISLADLKGHGPVTGRAARLLQQMFLEPVMRSEEEGGPKKLTGYQLRGFGDRFVQKRIYATDLHQGAAFRGLTSYEGTALQYPWAASQTMPFYSEIGALMRQVNDSSKGGLLDLQNVATIPRDEGNGIPEQTFQLGGTVPFHSLLTRLSEQAQQSWPDEATAESFQNQLADAQRVSGAFADQETRQQWAHTMAIMHQVSTGRSSYNKENKSGLSGSFWDFVNPMKTRAESGSYTLEHLVEFTDAMDEATRYLRDTGMVKRAHLERTLSSMFLNPQNTQQFAGLDFLQQHGMMAGEDELPLTSMTGAPNLVDLLAGQKGQKRGSLLEQFTRTPLIPGQRYRVMAEQPGYARIRRKPGQAGLRSGMVGTLMPWSHEHFDDPKEDFLKNRVGRPREKNPYITNELFGSKEEIAFSDTQENGVLFPPLWVLRAGGKEYPVRSDQLAPVGGRLQRGMAVPAQQKFLDHPRRAEIQQRAQASREADLTSQQMEQAHKIATARKATQKQKGNLLSPQELFHLKNAGLQPGLEQQRQILAARGPRGDWGKHFSPEFLRQFQQSPLASPKLSARTKMHPQTEEAIAAVTRNGYTRPDTRHLALAETQERSGKVQKKIRERGEERKKNPLFGPASPAGIRQWQASRQLPVPAGALPSPDQILGPANARGTAQFHFNKQQQPSPLSALKGGGGSRHGSGSGGNGGRPPLPPVAAPPPGPGPEERRQARAVGLTPPKGFIQQGQTPSAQEIAGPTVEQAKSGFASPMPGYAIQTMVGEFRKQVEASAGRKQETQQDWHYALDRHLTAKRQQLSPADYQAYVQSVAQAIPDMQGDAASQGNVRLKRRFQVAGSAFQLAGMDPLAREQSGIDALHHMPDLRMESMRAQKQSGPLPEYGPAMPPPEEIAPPVAQLAAHAPTMDELDQMREPENFVSAAQAGATNPISDEMMHPLPSPAEQRAGLANWIYQGNPQNKNFPVPSEEQRGIYASTAPNVLFEAGPGTGKTHALLHADVYRSMKENIPLRNIQYLSAMRSGVEEIATRQKEMEPYLPDSPDMTFRPPQTYYGMAYHILSKDVKRNPQSNEMEYPALKNLGINYSGRLLYELSDEEKKGVANQLQRNALEEDVDQNLFLRQAIKAQTGQTITEEQARGFLENIQEAKSNRTGDPTDVYTSRYKEGEQAISEGRLTGQAALVHYQNYLERQPKRDMDFPDLLYYASQALAQGGKGALPNDMQTLQGFSLDEAQDNTNSGLALVGQVARALPGIRTTTAMDAMQALIPAAFGSADPNTIPAAYEQQFGPTEHHQLTINRRSDRGPVSLVNAIRAHPYLRGQRKSAEQTASTEEIGKHPIFTEALSQPSLYKQMWRDMLANNQVDPKQIAKNVRSGKHPLEGIELPKIAGVVTRRADLKLFHNQAKEALGEDTGLSPQETAKAYEQIATTDRRKRNDNKIYMGLHAKHRSHAYDQVYADVTHVGGGNEAELMRRNLIAFSRVSHGGQNYAYHTEHPFRNQSMTEQYLHNPSLLREGAGGVVHFGGRYQQTQDRNASETFAGMRLPAGWSQIFQQHYDNMLGQGYAPEHAYFPKEARPYLRQQARKLFPNRGQHPQPAQPFARKQQASAPPPPPPRQTMTPPPEQDEDLLSQALATPATPGLMIDPSEIVRTSTPRPQNSGDASGLAGLGSIHPAFGALAQMPGAGQLASQLPDQERDQLGQMFSIIPGAISSSYQDELKANPALTPDQFLQPRLQSLQQDLTSGKHGVTGQSLTPRQQLETQGAVNYYQHLQQHPEELAKPQVGAPPPPTANRTGTGGTPGGKPTITADQVNVNVGPNGTVHVNGGAPSAGGAGAPPSGGSGGGSYFRNVPPGVPPIYPTPPAGTGRGAPGAPATATGGGGQGGPPPDEGKKPPGFGMNNPVLQFGHTFARIGDELAYMGQNMQKTADSAIQEGSDYRLATLQTPLPAGATTDAFGTPVASLQQGNNQVAAPTSPGGIGQQVMRTLTNPNAEGQIIGNQIGTSIFGTPTKQEQQMTFQQSAGYVWEMITNPKKFASDFTTAMEQRQSTSKGENKQQPTPTGGSAGGNNGTQGFYDFTNPSNPNTIGWLQQNILPMFSSTQIAQEIRSYLSSVNQPETQGGIRASTDILAQSAMSGIDQGTLTAQYADITGYNQRGVNKNAQVANVAGMANQMFQGNMTEQNLTPYLNALASVVPTLEGQNAAQLAPGFHEQPVNQAAAASGIFQMALNAGMTPANLPDVATMTNNLANIGYSPDLRGQYALSKDFGAKNMTASPQLAQYNQQMLGNQQQLAGMQLQQKMQVPQLTIQADNAQITLAKVNLEAQQFGLAQNQAQFNFSQWMQTQQYGPIGQDTSRTAYFDWQRRQQAAGYNPANADTTNTFKPSQPFGLQNEEFYAGVENQRSMLTLGRSSLLSDAAFQQQMKYLNEQENFYVREIDLQSAQRAFDKDWGQRSLNMQAEELAAQKKMLPTQIAQLEYDKANAALQAKYLPLQITALQSIITNTQQYMNGQGPVNGKNVSPTQIIESLMSFFAGDKSKNRAQDLQDKLQSMGLGQQDSGILMRMITQNQNLTPAQIISMLSSQGDSGILAQLGNLTNNGGFGSAAQNAANANSNLAQGGTGQDWQNLITAMQQDTQANQQLATLMSSNSGLIKHLGDLSSTMAPLTTGIGTLTNMIGAIAGMAGGAGGAMGGAAMGGGGGGSIGPAPSGGAALSSSMLHPEGVGGPIPEGNPGSSGSRGPQGDPRNTSAGFWEQLLEAAVTMGMMKRHQTNYSHFGINTPNVNADFHDRMWYGLHQGVDFAAGQGTPISEFIGGEVKATGFFPWGGEVDMLIPGGMVERYLHLSQIGVTPGQKVKSGQSIGLTGGGTPQSGYGFWSHGPHSHVQIDYGDINHASDPWPIWAAFGQMDLGQFYNRPSGGPPPASSAPAKGPWHLPHPGIGGGGFAPGLADGGIAMRPIITPLSEKEPEAVVPLSKLKSVMEMISGGGGPGSGQTVGSLSTSRGPTLNIQQLIGTMHLAISPQSGTLTDGDKDQLIADAVDVINLALRQALGKMN